MRDPRETSVARRLAGLAERAKRFFEGMAGRLVLFTMVVVVVAEILVFFPTLATFHEAWLRDRINIAQTAALALEASDTNVIATSLRRELLESAEVKRVALRREGRRMLILEEPFNRPPPSRLPTFDYRGDARFMRLAWALETFFAPEGRVIRVLARPRYESGDFIEIVLNEAPLKRAMNAYALQTFVFSTAGAVLAGLVVYFVLLAAFVRPVRRLTNAIERFRDHPEDASIPFRRSSRADEIGRAERAALEMSQRIRQDLKQRERLAALGGAVARIAHDLRSMLAPAQLASERLSESSDPAVRALALRLERSIGRAAGLAASAARVGRVEEEAQAVLSAVKLRAALDEAAVDALAAAPAAEAAFDVDPGVCVIADPDHLHRIFVNLMRNSAQACASGSARLRISARVEGEIVLVDVADNGPGVPEGVRERLFEPFAAGKAGGAGLGLSIARELARGLGGDVELARSTSEGAVFRVTLPLSERC